MDIAQEYPAPQDGLMVVVVGASAGGLAALKSLVANLPFEPTACFLAVLHVVPGANVGHLAHMLNQAGRLECSEASDGDPLEAGRFYLAPSDHHLMVDKEKIWVTRGPRENRWRPSIDVLFRSAAVHHRGRVIGVLLSGALDDGVAGLSAIRRCGGACVVQNPADALFPEMPATAIQRLKIDEVATLAEMGETLHRLIKEGPRESDPPPRALLIEARVPLGSRMTTDDMDGIGKRSATTCPECGGVLWELSEGGSLRFRCHTGHSFTGAALEEDQAQKIEETLWAAVRLFEERRNLLQAVRRYGSSETTTDQRVEETESHLRLLRRLLVGEASDAAVQ